MTETTARAPIIAKKPKSESARFFDPLRNLEIREVVTDSWSDGAAGGVSRVGDIGGGSINHARRGERKVRYTGQRFGEKRLN
jgi:hypothetical protein